MIRSRQKIDNYLAPLELVPTDEHPYRIPNNWQWVRGSSIMSPMKTRNPSGDFFSYIDIDAIDNRKQRVTHPKRIAVSKAPSRARRQLHEGDTIFSLVRPYLRNIAYIDASLSDCIASTGFFVCTPTSFIDGRYLYYLMTSTYVVQGLTKMMKGDNSPSIRKKDIENFPFPLPPIEEQHRIVNRIESLFAKLDNAEEKLHGVAENASSGQAAILHKAFTGKLTSSWRQAAGISDDSWSIESFSKIATIETNLVDPLDFPNAPHIAPDNIEKKTGVLLNYRTIKEDGVKSGKHRFHAGQILYSKIRPYLSKCVIVDFDGLCSADMYPINAMQDTRYLWYYMLSQDFVEQTFSAGSRTVLPKINKKGLGAITVPIPCIEEQREIVRILDSYFNKLHTAQSQVNQALIDIDALRKTILIKALHGELSANASSEE